MDDREPEAWRPSKTPAGETESDNADAGNSSTEEQVSSDEAENSPEARSQTGPAAPSPPAEDPDRDSESREFESFGYDLASVMEANDYHPVILFGTTNSGKTSLLMSLFSVLRTESDRLKTGLSLCAPLLGRETNLARALHEDARHTFEIKTLAFQQGEKIPSTKLKRPFFIPVEFKPPDGKESVKFAFLESNGEWYQTLQERGQRLNEMSELYKELQPQIQQVIERYQGGISFLYMAPYTQGSVYGEADNHGDVVNLEGASQALVGVLKEYEKTRQNGGRPYDKHLMLVTKWDKRGAGAIDRAKEIEEDREDLGNFFATKYMQAHAEFVSLNVNEGQRSLNAYCSGIMGDKGLLPLGRDEETKEVVEGYPIRLWGWLYKNALAAKDEPVVNPFPEGPRTPGIFRWFKNVLDAISGR